MDQSTTNLSTSKSSDMAGEGIKLSGVPRSELFLASKFSAQFARPENVEVCVDMELKALGTDYLDLFMAHHPVAFKTVGDITKAVMTESFDERCIAVDSNNNFIPDLEHSPRRIAKLNGSATGSFLPTWRAMKDLVRKGKVRAIGVSNFDLEDLEELLEDSDPSDPDDIPLSANQIETHPWFPNTKLLDFMRSHDILPISYSPLATIRESYVNGIYGSILCQPDGISLIDEPVVGAIAQKHGIGRAQVLHSWVAAQGVASLCRTYTLERMRENLDVRVLDREDLDRLAKLEKEGTRGKSFILTLCFPPIDFGDLPEELRENGKKSAGEKEVEKVGVVELVQGVSA